MQLVPTREERSSLHLVMEEVTAITDQLSDLGGEEVLLQLLAHIDKNLVIMNVIAYQTGGVLEAMKVQGLWDQGDTCRDFDEWLRTSHISHYGYHQLLHWMSFYALIKNVERLGLDYQSILHHLTPLSQVKRRHIERLVRVMDQSYLEIVRRQMNEEDTRKELALLQRDANSEITRVLEASEEILVAEAVARMQNANAMEPLQLTMRGLRRENNELVFEVRVPVEDMVWAHFSANKVKWSFQLPGDSRYLSPKEVEEHMEE